MHLLALLPLLATAAGYKIVSTTSPTTNLAMQDANWVPLLGPSNTSDSYTLPSYPLPGALLSNTTGLYLNIFASGDAARGIRGVSWGQVSNTSVWNVNAKGKLGAGEWGNEFVVCTYFIEGDYLFGLRAKGTLDVRCTAGQSLRIVKA